ncbi:MICOS complex subunit mic25a like [Actinidia chinensis var. chinensis]|uniref:MICOS complex subunit mic25a like n=1 Tax=Actinidia chinensis var. chinensis TaxID=1590841 RepID=A0A2R6PI57_ACTCC|nr:MICOS complex subunit mic25a like [Actinidia chinensis var. chinensis]
MGESFTIQISSNLVKQLTDDGEKSKRKNKRSKPKIPQEPQQSQSKVHPKQISGDSEAPKVTPPMGWPVQPPFFMPITPPPQAASPELDAIRSVVQESEKVLERLQKQEEVLAQEVTQRAKDLHDKEFKLPNQKTPPCLTERGACFDCYKEHVKDPLKCADLVKNYADCIRRDRQQVS